MSAPGEDLAQGHTADGRRPTSKGVFCSFDILNAPAQIFQPGGWVSLGPGCRGRAPLQASEPKISLVRFSVTRVFLKKSVFKSV